MESVDCQSPITGLPAENPPCAHHKMTWEVFIAPMQLTDAEMVSLLNRIFNQNREFHFQMNENEFAFTLQPLAFTFAPDVSVTVRMGEARLCLALEKGVCDEILTDVNSAKLPVEFKGLVLESLLEPLLNRLEWVSKTACSIENISFLPTPISLTAPSIYFRLSRVKDNIAVAGNISTDRSGLALLAQLFDSLPELPGPVHVDGLPILGRIEIGKTRLSVKDLKSLRRHDIILMDEGAFTAENKIGRMHFSSNLSIKGRFDQHHWIVTSFMENVMSDAKTVPERDALQENVLPGLDQLDIDLVFEIGAQKITIGDLKKIKPGYTFDLGKRIDRPIIVRANGKLIARGEIVQFQNNIGVRLLEVDL